jgi:SHS2 domain-containing protein
LVTGYEILEHTADVGVRATGATIEACFENATRGLTEIMGIGVAGRGEEVALAVNAADREALLVEWLDEVIYLHETRDAAIVDVRVDRVTEGRATGSVQLVARRPGPSEGTPVKAVTFHQLRVEATPDGCLAEVFFDV